MNRISRMILIERTLSILIILSILSKTFLLLRVAWWMRKVNSHVIKRFSDND